MTPRRRAPPRRHSGSRRASPGLLAGLALLFLTALPRPVTAGPLRLSGPQSHSLAGHLEALPDPGASPTFPEALAAAGRFQPLPGFFNRGYTREATWVRFTFARAEEAPTQLYLCLGVPFLDEVTVYLQEGADPADPASYREHRLGDHVPAADRPLPHPNLVLPLAVPDTAPRTAYVRVRTSGTLLLHGAILGPEAFLAWTQRLTLLQGGYLAVTLTVGLINLIFAFQVRDRTYGYYALYVFALFATYSSVSGMLTVLWPAAAHRLSDLAASFGTLGGFAAFSLFAARLFATEAGPRWAHLSLRAMVMLTAAAGATYPLGSYSYVIPLVLVGGLGIVTLTTVLALRMVAAGAPAGRLFLYAFGFSNTAAAVVFLRVLGVLPATGVTVYALQVGEVLHMILMTLALTQRVRAAEHTALAAARDAELRAVELARGMTDELRARRAALEESLAAEQLARGEQSRLLDVLAHEYRTPLAILRANLDILGLKDRAAGQLWAPYLAKMERATTRLVELFEAARVRPVPTAPSSLPAPVPLAALLEEARDEADALWGPRFHLDLGPAEGLAVLGDRAQLKTVLLNLAENAVNYSAPATPVALALRAEGGEAVVSVTNAGQALSAAEAEAVFQKYRRGPNSTGTTGLGLGLYLVRQIAEAHGGAARLNPGGTGRVEVEVRLPRYQPREDLNAGLG
ncbi:MAG: sensor histidine kinase [Deferrisomatales bacterium]